MLNDMTTERPSKTRAMPIAMMVIAALAVLAFVIVPLVLGFAGGEARECTGPVLTDTACFR
jgi:cell division septal protein FtsQ